MNVLDLQKWLNVHGAKLVEDGRGGPATRAAILSVFTNKKAPAATDTDIRAIAAFLGDPNGFRLRKVAKVEAAGDGFFNSGLPKILYERHKFWRFTKGRFGVSAWSNSKRGGYSNDADGNGINDSWEKLCRAACQDPLAAFASVSIGKFQVMGFHAEKLGYGNGLEMMWQASRSEAAHYEMCARYIDKFGLRDEFLQLSNDPDDCRPFALGYNGPDYEAGAYHIKLAEA